MNNKSIGFMRYIQKKALWVSFSLAAICYILFHLFSFIGAYFVLLDSFATRSTIHTNDGLEIIFQSHPQYANFLISLSFISDISIYIWLVLIFRRLGRLISRLGGFLQKVSL